MLGTAFRLFVAFVCFLLMLVPLLNLVTIPLLGPVFLWCLVSGVRRIWRGSPTAVPDEDAASGPAHARLTR